MKIIIEHKCKMKIQVPCSIGKRRNNNISNNEYLHHERKMALSLSTLNEARKWLEAQPRDPETTAHEEEEEGRRVDDTFDLNLSLIDQGMADAAAMELAVGGEIGGGEDGGGNCRNVKRRESSPVCRGGGHVITGIRQKLPHQWLYNHQDVLNDYGVFLQFERNELAQ